MGGGDKYLHEVVAYLLNRLDVCKDGKPPYERIKGKTLSVLAVHEGPVQDPHRGQVQQDVVGMEERMEENNPWKDFCGVHM